jgi:hypothetical protein
MANNYIHGVSGTVTLNGTLFNVKQFSFTMTNDLADITHSGAQGYQVMLPGVTRAAGQLTFTYDTLNQPTVSPLNQKPGQSLALVLSPDGTKQYSFSAYSGELGFRSGPQAGDVEVTTSFQSSGVITVPTS